MRNVLIVLLVLAPLVSACGGTLTTPTSPTVTPEPTPTPTPAPTPEPTPTPTPRVAVFGTPAEVAANGGYGISAEILSVRPGIGAVITPTLRPTPPETLWYIINHCVNGRDDPQNRCYRYNTRFCNTTGVATRATLGFAASATGPILVGFRNVRTEIPAEGCVNIFAPESADSAGIFDLGGVTHFTTQVERKPGVEWQGPERHVLDMKYTTARP